jgi:hypothetical protein
MRNAQIVYKHPEECKAAMKSMAYQRKFGGASEVFLGNGTVRLDNIIHFDTVNATVTRRPKGSPKLPPRQLVGTPIEAYYIGGGEETEEAKAEAANAIANGIDPRAIKGLLLDVGFSKSGALCCKVTNVYRTNKDGGPSYRTLNLDTGILVAFSVGKSLGISPEKLKAEGDKYDALKKKKAAAGPALPGMEGVTGEAEAKDDDDNQAGEAPVKAEPVSFVAAIPPEDLFPEQAPSDVTANQAAEGVGGEPPEAVEEAPKQALNPLVEKLKALSNQSLGLNQP